MLKNTQEHKDNDYEIVVIYERVPRSYPAQLESVNVAKELIFRRHGINVYDQSVDIHEIVVKHNGVRLSARKEQKFWNKIHSMQGNGCSVQPYPSVKDIQTEQLLKIVAIDQFKKTETSFRPVLSAIKLPNQLSEAIPKKTENEKLSYFVTDELISDSITGNYLEAFQIMNTRHKSILNHFELTRNLNSKDLLADHGKIFEGVDLTKLADRYDKIDTALSWTGSVNSIIQDFSEYQQSRIQSRRKKGEIFYRPTSVERLTDVAIASSKVYLLNLVDAYAYQMITQPVIRYAFLKYAVPLVIAGPIPVSLSVGIDAFIIISNIAFSRLTSKFIYTPLENKFWECYEHFSAKTSKIWRGQTALKNLTDNRYPLNSYSIQLRMEEFQEDHVQKSKVLSQNLNLSCLNFTPKIIKPLSLQWSVNEYNVISWLHDDKPVSFTKNLIANNQFLPIVNIPLKQSVATELSATQQQDNKIKIQIKPTINPIQVLVPKLEQSTKSRESRGNLVIEKNNQGNLQYQLTINDPIKHPIFSTVLITAHYLLKQLPYWFSSDKRKAQLNLEAALKKLKSAEQGDWFNFEKLFSFKTKEQLIEQRHDEVCHELTNFINVFHDQKDLQVQALAMRHSLIHNRELLKELPDLTNIYAFYFEHFQKLHQDFSRFFAFGPKANEIANKMVKEFPFIPESHIAYAKTLFDKDPILAKRYADEAVRINIEINKKKTINSNMEQMKGLSVVKIDADGTCFMLGNEEIFQLTTYRIAALRANEQDKAQQIKEYKDLLKQHNIINIETTAIDDSLLLEIEDPIALVNHTNQTNTLLSKGNAVVSQIQTIDMSKQTPVDIKNNPHEWIDTFKHYLVTHPDDLEVRIGLMSTHYLAGNYAAVFEEATQLQKQKCTDDRIYLMLGLCYLQEGKLEKAKQQLALGHDANPNNSETKRLLEAIKKQLILIRCQQISMVLQLGVEIAEIGFNFALARQYHQLMTAQTTMKVYLPVPRNKEIQELSCLAFFPNQKSDRQVQQNKTATVPLQTIEQSSSASFFQSRSQPRPTLASRTGADLLIAAQTVDTTRPRRNQVGQVVSSNQPSSTSFFRPSNQSRSTSSSKAGADLLIAAQTVNTTQPRHNKAERFTSFI